MLPRDSILGSDIYEKPVQGIMPQTARPLDERMWQLSFQHPSHRSGSLNKHVVPRAHTEPCDEYERVPMVTSLEAFKASNAETMALVMQPLAAVEVASPEVIVTVDYDITDNVLRADINLNEIFKYTRTPLLLSKVEANWLMTVPVLSAANTVSLRLRSRASPYQPVVTTTYQVAAEPQYHEVQIEGFTVVVVLNSRAAACGRYTKQARCAEEAAGHLSVLLRRVEATFNTHVSRAINSKKVPVRTRQTQLCMLDRVLAHARGHLGYVSEALVCRDNSDMITAMTVASDKSGGTEWEISEEDVLMSMNLEDPVFLLDDDHLRYASTSDHMLGLQKSLENVYVNVNWFMDTFIDLDCMTDLMFPETHTDVDFLGLRGLCEQRQSLVCEISEQTMADKSSNYQKPLNRVLYLVLNCIDCCLCFNIDSMCGIASDLHDVCLHSRQLQHLGRVLPNERALVARGHEMIARAMSMRSSKRAYPGFLSTDVMQELWKVKIIHLVELRMNSQLTLFHNSNTRWRGQVVDRSICRIAWKHNEYYAKMKSHVTKIHSLELRVCVGSKWRQIFELIVFGDLQMQVIRSKDTMNLLMDIRDNSTEFMHDAAVLEYMRSHPFIELLTFHMAGWETPSAVMEEGYRRYIEDC